ncbi:hypothetical protein D3C85_1778360 [compost metagenome]
MYAVLVQPLDVGVATQYPQQLDHYTLEEGLLQGNQREAFLQVEAHLVAENLAGTGAGAIHHAAAVVDDALDQFLVLFHGNLGG